MSRPLIAILFFVVLLTGGSVSAAYAQAVGCNYASRAFPAASHDLVVAMAKSAEGLVTVGDLGQVQLLDEEGAFRCWGKVPVERLLTGVSFPQHGETGWAVGYDGLIMRTDDGGQSWKVQRLQEVSDKNTPSPYFDVYFFDKERGVAVGAYGLVSITNDAGATWRDLKLGSDEKPETRHVYSVIPLDGEGLLLVGEGGGEGSDDGALLYMSADAGTTWEKLAPPYSGTLFGGLMLDRSKLLVFGLRGNIFRSNDRGATWSKVSTQTDSTLFGAVKISSDEVVLLGSDASMLDYRWDTGSVEKVGAQGGVNETLQSGIFLNKNLILVAGSRGVHKVTLGTNTSP